MLTQACGRRLPIPAVPPMTVKDFNHEARRGSSRSASATLVCAPMIATSSSPRCARASCLQQELDRVHIERVAIRRGQIGAVEAARPVRVGGERRLADERRATAPGHRNVEARQSEHAQRIGCCLFDGLVAEHGRDADDIEMARGEEDRDGVVMSGVAVDEEFRHAQLRPAVFRRERC